MDIAKRPRGLVPGSMEWLREMEGPRLLTRLVEEIHASPAGEMTPTAARCAGMLLPIIYPTLSAVHHTVETTLSKESTEDLQARFAKIMSEQRTLEASQPLTVDFTEIPVSVPMERDHDNAELSPIKCGLSD
ncbi:hypothetical protein [Glaciimonas immobilis]|uniref:Uncharacterized protein n=1 Tax=Glaciimonas immobilis TaxID=728004 RepID=A0A840RT03_9BURK|nr:hypothetical protein [Glaciimonas immobilis]KAF3997533.1 hypothetical protein HAV38_12705 [Glaciimonas immobilis]MBB5200783.1 hypothetical protein [Glaciimonas immobilis]